MTFFYKDILISKIQVFSNSIVPYINIKPMKTHLKIFSKTYSLNIYKNILNKNKNIIRNNRKIDIFYFRVRFSFFP